jgi:hypothetical protein
MSMYLVIVGGSGSPTARFRGFGGGLHGTFDSPVFGGRFCFRPRRFDGGGDGDTDTDRDDAVGIGWFLLKRLL